MKKPLLVALTMRLKFRGQITSGVAISFLAFHFVMWCIPTKVQADSIPTSGDIFQEQAVGYTGYQGIGGVGGAGGLGGAGGASGGTMNEGGDNRSVGKQGANGQAGAVGGKGGKGGQGGTVTWEVERGLNNHSYIQVGGFDGYQGAQGDLGALQGGKGGYGGAIVLNDISEFGLMPYPHLPGSGFHANNNAWFPHSAHNAGSLGNKAGGDGSTGAGGGGGWYGDQNSGAGYTGGNGGNGADGAVGGGGSGLQPSDQFYRSNGNLTNYAYVRLGGQGGYGGNGGQGGNGGGGGGATIGSLDYVEYWLNSENSGTGGARGDGGDGGDGGQGGTGKLIVGGNPYFISMFLNYDDGNIIINDGSELTLGINGSLFNGEFGTAHIRNDGTINNSGGVFVNSGQVVGNGIIQQTAGATINTSIMQQKNINITGGGFESSGEVSGDITIGSNGKLTVREANSINGNLTLEDGSTAVFYLDTYPANLLTNVSDNLFLAGDLVFLMYEDFFNGFEIGDSIDLMAAENILGEFDSWMFDSLDYDSWTTSPLGFDWGLDYIKDAFGTTDVVRLSLQSAPAPVPEPATFILLGSGLAGLVFYRRKRK